MPVQVKCTFCNHPFEFDVGGGSLLATCPNCGRQTVVAVPGRTTQRLQIIRNAPALDGGKSCPKCNRQIPRDAETCVNCGHNLLTGRSIKLARAPMGRKTWLLPGMGALLLALAVAAYRLWSAAESDQVPPQEVPPPGLPVPMEIESQTPAEPAARPEATASARSPVEEREDFEARRARAAETFRRKLNEDAPLYRQGDQIELRLKTGRIIHGMLVLAGKGTNRVAILETEDGKTIIPYEKMDRDSRIRLDGKYREEHIRRTLKLPPADSTELPAKQNQREGPP